MRPFARPSRTTLPETDHAMRAQDQLLAATYVRQLADIALQKEGLLSAGQEIDKVLDEYHARQRNAEHERWQANRAFIIQGAQTLESLLSIPKKSTLLRPPRFDSATISLAAEEPWVTLRANTVFFLPPKDSSLGLETIYRPDFSPEAVMKARQGQVTSREIIVDKRHRPLPALLIGHAIDKSAKKSERHQYLALVPSAQLDPLKVEAGYQPTLSPSGLPYSAFSIVGIHTKDPLQYPDPVPTDSEIQAATSLSAGFYTFNMLRSSRDTTSYPRVTRLDDHSYRESVRDADMERFGVLNGIHGLLTEFGQPELFDPLLDGLVTNRQHQ